MYTFICENTCYDAEKKELPYEIKYTDLLIVFNIKIISTVVFHLIKKSMCSS